MTDLSQPHVYRTQVNAYSNTRSVSSGQFFATGEGQFALPRGGNAVKGYIFGSDFFADVAAAIRDAQRFILLADWQMDWDVELVDRGKPGHPGRLCELLRRAVSERDVHVKILLYNSMDVGLDTHDAAVKEVLTAIGTGVRGKIEVALQRPMTGRDEENVGFSHHQKIVVVDGTTAFVGGLDLTYGRWGDGNFDLIADPHLQRINELYNPGLPQGRKLTAHERRLVGKDGGERLFAPPFYLPAVVLGRVRTLIQSGRTAEEIAEMLRSVNPQAAVVGAFKKEYDDFMNRYRMLRDGDLSGLSEEAFKELRAKFDRWRRGIGLVSDAIRRAAGEKVALWKEYVEDPKLYVEDLELRWRDLLGKPDYFISDYCLEEGCQPRLPWQDVHVRISGPSAFDVYKNFVRRWNLACEDSENRGIARLDKSWLDSRGGRAAIFGTTIGKGRPSGKAAIQIVRSTSAALVAAELRRINAQNLMDSPEGSPAYAAELLRVTSHADGHTGILQAMLNSIASAQAYIYIENQFFISQMGRSDKHESSAKIQNQIVAALARRIREAIQASKNFHVYVVLPTHPEGSPGTAPVAKQQYWILQTILRGAESLVRRVSESIVRKERGITSGVVDPQAVEQCIRAVKFRRYLTFLNLRSFGFSALYHRGPDGENDKSRELNRFVLTEQIYVHSKCMIVDDTVAIIGSANVNDRSLRGDGDTEIAAVIVDSPEVGCERQDLGSGDMIPTRKFARELRHALWQKLFGYKISMPKDCIYTRSDRTGISNAMAPARAPLPYPPRTYEQAISGVDAGRPADPATVMAIQNAAYNNQKIYEEIFTHVPSNAMATFSEALKSPRPIPRRGATSHEYYYFPPALQKAYMKPAPAGALVPTEWRGQVHDVEKAARRLKDLRGFIVEMPLWWGIAERDRWLGGGFGMFMIAQNDPQPSEGSAVLSEFAEVSTDRSG